MRTSTPSSVSDGKVVDSYVVHISDHLKMDLLSQFKQWEYRFYKDKDGKKHQKRGLSTEEVTLELVRPDRMIGTVCNWNGPHKLEEWIDGFMIPGQPRKELVK